MTVTREIFCRCVVSVERKLNIFIMGSGGARTTIHMLGINRNLAAKAKRISKEKEDAHLKIWGWNGSSNL